MYYSNFIGISSVVLFLLLFSPSHAHAHYAALAFSFFIKFFWLFLVKKSDCWFCSCCNCWCATVCVSGWSYSCRSMYLLLWSRYYVDNNEEVEPLVVLSRFCCCVDNNKEHEWPVVLSRRFVDNNKRWEPLVVRVASALNT